MDEQGKQKKRKKPKQAEATSLLGTVPSLMGPGPDRERSARGKGQHPGRMRPTEGTTVPGDRGGGTERGGPGHQGRRAGPKGDGRDGQAQLQPLTHAPQDAQESARNATRKQKKPKKKKAAPSVLLSTVCDSGSSGSSDSDSDAQPAPVTKSQHAQPTPGKSKKQTPKYEDMTSKAKAKKKRSVLPVNLSSSEDSSDSDFDAQPAHVIKKQHAQPTRGKSKKQTPKSQDMTSKYKAKKKRSVLPVNLSSSRSNRASDVSDTDSDNDGAAQPERGGAGAAALSQEQMDTLKGELLNLLLEQQGSSKQSKPKPETKTKTPEATYPTLCIKHNSKEGCSRGKDCNHLHVCRNFIIKGDCKFETRCKGGHNLYAHQPRALLARRGVDVSRPNSVVLEELRQQAKNKPGRKDPDIPQRADDSMGGGRTEKAREKAPDAGRPICSFYMRGACNYGDACTKNHSEQPYLWLYKLAGEPGWTQLDRAISEEVERQYANPANTECSSQVTNSQGKKVSLHVNFEKLSVFTDGCAGEARRLSTPSYVKCPPSDVFSTRWLWFWQGEDGTWTSYDQEEKGGKRTSPVTGKEIEEKYLSGPSPPVQFSTDANSYRILFPRMVQVNVRHGTDRPVTRRPAFMSADKVELLKQMHSQKTQSASGETAAGGLQFETPVPEHWDESLMEGTGDCQLAEVTRTGDTKKEYVKIENLFFDSMPEARFAISKLYRIQSMELWDKYTRNKTWKRKKGGKDQQEKILFHGTSKQNVDGICQHGFDWRIAGASVGTRYGKGSYFATTASFAKDYSDTKLVFVVRVLVGESTLGDPDYVKPPPKNPKQPKGPAYDCCVNSVDNPTMYVIFEQERAYPEYLIRFKKNK